MADRCWNLLVMVDGDDSCISYLCGLIDVGGPFFVVQEACVYTPVSYRMLQDGHEYMMLPYVRDSKLFMRDTRLNHKGHLG